MNSVKDEYIFDESLGRYPYSFSFGIKEILFLVIIFSFGFLGFSLCIEKVYISQNENKIDNLMIHDIELSNMEETTTFDQLVTDITTKS